MWVSSLTLRRTRFRILLKRVKATTQRQYGIFATVFLVVPTVDPIILGSKMGGWITPETRSKDMVQLMIDSIEGTKFGRGYVRSYESPWVSRYCDFV